MMTIEEKIKLWMEIFEGKCPSMIGFPGKEEINLSLQLIDEELQEIKDGIKNKDITEVQDGLGDTLWVVIRMMLKFGIDPAETIDAIFKSNMSKACETEEEAIKSVEAYTKQGIATTYKQVGGIYVIIRSWDKKILKSINFQPPKF